MRRKFKKIRGLFFEKFEIIKLNIFSEQVFDDTTYNVISFYFRKRQGSCRKNVIDATIYPENKKIKLTLEKIYDWQFGGDFIHNIKSARNDLGVFRLTEDYLKSGEYEAEIALQNIKDKKILKISDDIKSYWEKIFYFCGLLIAKMAKKFNLKT